MTTWKLNELGVDKVSRHVKDGRHAIQLAPKVQAGRPAGEWSYL